MNSAGSRDLRRSRRADPWRALDEHSRQSRIGEELQRRRAEDRFREEYHDACAKTIAAGPPVEQRQRGSGAAIRARREEQRRQWERRRFRNGRS
jgi:hypothetical protein